MSDYFFTHKQIDEIEALYSKVTLAKTSQEVQKATNELYIQLTRFRAVNVSLLNWEEPKAEQCHKDDMAFHDARGS